MNRVANFLPVCLMYALLQSGQVSLYAPVSENLSGAGCLWASKFLIVFLVRNATFISVFLNRVVGFSAYVSEAGPFFFLGGTGFSWVF